MGMLDLADVRVSGRKRGEGSTRPAPVARRRARSCAEELSAAR
jgi:hypothetical protein